MVEMTISCYFLVAHGQSPIFMCDWYGEQRRQWPYGFQLVSGVCVRCEKRVLLS